MDLQKLFKNERGTKTNRRRISDTCRRQTCRKPQAPSEIEAGCIPARWRSSAPVAQINMAQTKLQPHSTPPVLYPPPTKSVLFTGPLLNGGGLGFRRGGLVEEVADQPDNIQHGQHPQRGHEFVCGGAPGDAADETATIGAFDGTPARGTAD